MKKTGYKPSTPNKNKGLATHGKFGNSGQKPGKKAPAGKESAANLPANEYLKKVVSDMRKQKSKNGIGSIGLVNGSY